MRQVRKQPVAKPQNSTSEKPKWQVFGRGESMGPYTKAQLQ
jgi:hypothetical protein